MFQYLEDKTPTEVENIRKTIQELFRQTCILKVKCDPETQIQRDNPHYQICNRHREFIAEYVEVMGCELCHDPQEYIFYLAGEGMPTEHLTLLNTKILLLLKLIYRDKIMGEGLHATMTNLREIREYGKDAGLLTRKLTQQEWYDALIRMKIHQIIEIPGAIRSLDDYTPIHIYPTINIFLRTADISEVVQQYMREQEESREMDHADVDQAMKENINRAEMEN